MVARLYEPARNGSANRPAVISELEDGQVDIELGTHDGNGQTSFASRHGCQLTPTGTHMEQYVARNRKKEPD